MACFSRLVLILFCIAVFSHSNPLLANHPGKSSVILFENKRFPELNLALRSQLSPRLHLTVVSKRVQSNFCQQLQQHTKSIVVISSSDVDKCHRAQLHLDNQYIIITDNISLLRQQQRLFAAFDAQFISTTLKVSIINQLYHYLTEQLGQKSSCIVGKGHQQVVVQLKQALPTCNLWVVQNHDTLSNIFRNFPFDDHKLVFFIKGNQKNKPPISTLLRKKHFLIAVGENWTRQGALLSIYYDSWDIGNSIQRLIKGEANDQEELVYPYNFQVKMNRLLDEEANSLLMDEQQLQAYLLKTNEK